MTARRNIVETERLILRPFEPTDEASYVAIRSKPEVARYLAGGEASAANGAEIAARLVPGFAALWNAKRHGPGYGPWSVVERTTGRLIGHLGLRLLPEFHGRTELLYALSPEAQGNGYAQEGAAAALLFGFDTLHLPTIIALALPQNAASLKVIDRVGMKRRPGLVEVFGLKAVMAEIDAATYQEKCT